MFDPFAEYCEMAGLSLMVVPTGFELSPPQMNANDVDVDEDDDDDRVDNDDDRVDVADDVRLKANDDRVDGLDAWG